jgi:hypothetical protein
MVEQLGSIVAVIPPLAVGRHTPGRVVPLRPRLMLTPRRAIGAAVPGVSEQMGLSALLRCGIDLEDMNGRVFLPGPLLRARVALAVALARGMTALTLDGFLRGLDACDVQALAATLLRLKRDGIACYVTCGTEDQARALYTMLDAQPNAEAAGLADDDRLAV